MTTEHGKVVTKNSELFRVLGLILRSYRGSMHFDKVPIFDLFVFGQIIHIIGSEPSQYFELFQLVKFIFLKEY